MSFIHKLVNVKKALYFPGCLTELLLKDVKDNYKAILSDLGIRYTTNVPFQCCGAPLLNAGHKEEFLELVEENQKLLQEHGFTKIIVNCPHCFHMFRKHYNFPVEHVTQTLSKNLSKIGKTKEKRISYHDPCYLGRKNNLYDEPRSVIKATGFLINETENNRQNAPCCGAGGLLKAAAPKLASSIAKNTLKHFRTKELVVACPLCYVHFKENKPENLKIKELSEVLIEI